MTHFPPFMYKHKSIFSFLGCTVGGLQEADAITHHNKSVLQ